MTTKRNSVAGNRTRVSWVKARYPNRWTTTEYLFTISIYIYIYIVSQAEFIEPAQGRYKRKGFSTIEDVEKLCCYVSSLSTSNKWEESTWHSKSKLPLPSVGGGFSSSSVSASSVNSKFIFRLCFRRLKVTGISLICVKERRRHS